MQSFHNSDTEFNDTHRFLYNLAVNSNYNVHSRKCCILGGKTVFIIFPCSKLFDNCLKLSQQGDLFLYYLEAMFFFIFMKSVTIIFSTIFKIKRQMEKKICHWILKHYIEHLLNVLHNQFKTMD